MKSVHGSAILKWSGSVILLAASVLPSVSWAALNAYAYITGQTHGAIQGGSTTAGHEGSIEVLSFGYNVSVPYDSASGLPSGRRQHRPIRILKDIDRASPLLFDALVNNELLTDVRIEFWRPDKAGQVVHYYTVELFNAHIVSIMPSQVSGAVDPNAAAAPERESVSFTFDRIETTYEDGSISSGDSW